MIRSVTEIVTEEFERTGRGLTRRELANILGLTQTRNIPGVRQAINDGLIRYDGTSESRLIPVEAVE